MEAPGAPPPRRRGALLAAVPVGAEPPVPGNGQTPLVGRPQKEEQQRGRVLYRGGQGTGNVPMYVIFLTVKSG